MQYNGRVMLSWTDLSFCETGFAITRDARGFTSDYNFAAAVECGETHAPQTIFDDLTSQPMDAGLYEADARSNFAWPDGGNYAQKLNGNKRWPASPSSTSTTTTLGGCLLAAIRAGSVFHAYARRNADETGYECALYTGSFTAISTVASPSDTTVLQRYTWQAGVAGTYIIDGDEATCRAKCSALEYADCSAVITDDLGCALMQVLKAADGAAARFSTDATVQRRVPAMPVGSTHIYCVSAINPVGYGTLGYVSDQVS